MIPSLVLGVALPATVLAIGIGLWAHARHVERRNASRLRPAE